MSDRELLAMAAKAAGYPYEVVGNYVWINGDYHSPEDTRPWSPLDDDGEALRLAVKLGIRSESDILTLYFGGTQSEFFFNHGHADEKSFMVDHSGDPYAATRRAIVMAAAEIGKAMTKE